MKVIGNSRFIIETSAPTGKFKNKQIDGFDDDGKPCKLTVPLEEPEYEYLWFCGMGLYPDNPKVMGAVWSPYPAQAFQYKDRDEATIVNEKILGPEAGGNVYEVNASHWREGRQVIVPVDAGDVVEGISRSGIKGGRL